MRPNAGNHIGLSFPKILTPCGAPACGAPLRAPPLGRRTRTRQARPHGRDGAAALAWAPLAHAADQLGRHQRRRAPPPTRRRAPPLATRPPPPTARLRDASGTALPAPHPAARRLLARADLIGRCVVAGLAAGLAACGGAGAAAASAPWRRCASRRLTSSAFLPPASRPAAVSASRSSATRSFAGWASRASRLSPAQEGSRRLQGGL